MKNLSFLLLIAVFVSSCYKSEKADLVVHNAYIYAIDEGFSIHQAMAIKDGKILELGKEQQILNKYRATEIVDAKTRPIFPGFFDDHCHFLNYALSLQQVNLIGTTSYNEVLHKIKEHYEQHPTAWIKGRGWDQNDWTVKKFPTKEKLDSLFPVTPVFVKRVDGHAALANSVALKLANITNETQIEGGVIVKINGLITGVLIDNAMDLVNKIIPEESNKERLTALKIAEKNLFSFGLTTIDDAGTKSEIIDLIEEAQKKHELKIKVYVMVESNEQDLEKYLKKGPYKTDRLNVRSFKFMADGALGSRGACLLQPYSDIVEQEHYGALLHTPEFYAAYAQKLYDKGFQMNTHCIGDSANRMMLSIYANVLKKTNDRRWRIEHVQIMNEADFETFKTYNIIPSIQPTHCTSDMYWAENRVGKQRIKNAYAYKKLLKLNGLVALGTDFPVEDINTFKTFYAAVVRKDSKGYPEGGFQMENALTRKEAIKGMTIWAAIANFEENEKGSLEVGKAADFIILDKDLLQIPEKEILNTKVIATFINGEEVYKRR